MFRDRIDAGKQLGAALAGHKGIWPLVLGIPRGGAAVAYQVAQALACPFTILIIRKLPFPDNPEAGFGAVAEDGTVYLIPDARKTLPPALVDRVILQQQAEVIRRIKVLRGGQPLPDLRDRHVILVDDGIAMGSTMLAAVACGRHLGASRVTVAAPVASPGAYAALSAAADEMVVLLAPPRFQAVAEFYQRWYDVPDEEVVAIMDNAAKAGRLATPAPPRGRDAAGKSRRDRREAGAGPETA